MRHRMVTGTGLGNPSAPLIDGKSTGSKKRDMLINECAKESHDLFFTKYGYCDAQSRTDEIRLGVEPAYQFDPLKVVSIQRVKEMSYLMTGKSFAAYGSGIRSTKKYYRDYKYNSKFKQLIDKWHPQLFPHEN